MDKKALFLCEKKKLTPLLCGLTVGTLTFLCFCFVLILFIIDHQTDRSDLYYLNYQAISDTIEKENNAFSAMKNDPDWLKKNEENKIRQAIYKELATLDLEKNWSRELELRIDEWTILEQSSTGDTLLFLQKDIIQRNKQMDQYLRNHQIPLLHSQWEPNLWNSLFLFSEYFLLFFITIISTIFVSLLFAREVETKEIYLLLLQPYKRTELFIVKFCFVYIVCLFLLYFTFAAISLFSTIFVGIGNSIYPVFSRLNHGHLISVRSLLTAVLKGIPFHLALQLGITCFFAVTRFDLLAKLICMTIIPFFIQWITQSTSIWIILISAIIMIICSAKLFCSIEY